MDDPGSFIFKIVLLFVLIIVNAFFAMSEIAIISLNDNMIDKLAEEGHKKAKKVKKLTENPSNFLSTIQIGVTLAGFLTSASASTTFAAMLTEAVAPRPEHLSPPEQKDAPASSGCSWLKGALPYRVAAWPRRSSDSGCCHEARDGSCAGFFRRIR